LLLLGTIGTGLRRRPNGTADVPLGQTGVRGTTPTMDGGTGHAPALAAEIEPRLLPTGQMNSPESRHSIRNNAIAM
jgi:hypothetical protein